MSRTRLSSVRDDGFTLLELIVVVVVLAVLAALAVPAGQTLTDRSRDAQLTAELETLGRGVAAYAALRDADTVQVDDLHGFLAAETDAATSPPDSHSRWTFEPDDTTRVHLQPGPDGPVLPVVADVDHRDSHVAYLLIGLTGAAAEIVDNSHGTDPADALAWFGLNGHERQSTKPAPVTGRTADNPTGPAGPEAASLAHTGNDALVTWDPPSTGTVTGYTVQLSDGQTGTWTGGPLQVSFTGLDPDGDHTATVTAVGVNGSPSPATATTVSYAPGFDAWTLANGAYLEDDGTLVLPGHNTHATSPLMPINEQQFTFSAQFQADSPSGRHYPDAGSHQIWSYFDADGQPFRNACGHMSNGRAMRHLIGPWSERRAPTSLCSNLTGVAYVRVQMLNSSGAANVDNRYTPDTYRIRAPRFEVDS